MPNNTQTVLVFSGIPSSRHSFALQPCLACIKPLWHEVKIRWTVTIITKIKCHKFPSLASDNIPRRLVQNVLLYSTSTSTSTSNFDVNIYALVLVSLKKPLLFPTKLLVKVKVKVHPITGY